MSKIKRCKWHRSNYWDEGFICFSVTWTIWPKYDVANIIGNADISHSIRKWTVIDEMLIEPSMIQVNMQIKAHSFTDINANYRRILQKHQRSVFKTQMKCSLCQTALWIETPFRCNLAQDWTQMTCRISSNWTRCFPVGIRRLLRNITTSCCQIKLSSRQWDQTITFPAD